MSSCSVCRGLDLRVVGHETSFSTKTQFQNLRQQKQQGCVRCSLLLEGLENFKKSWVSINENIIPIYLYKQRNRSLEVYLRLPDTTLKFEYFARNSEWTIKLFRFILRFLTSTSQEVQVLGPYLRLATLFLKILFHPSPS
jgi:hypothetical protein